MPDGCFDYLHMPLLPFSMTCLVASTFQLNNNFPDADPQTLRIKCSIPQLHTCIVNFIKGFTAVLPSSLFCPSNCQIDVFQEAEGLHPLALNLSVSQGSLVLEFVGYACLFMNNKF